MTKAGSAGVWRWWRSCAAWLRMISEFVNQSPLQNTCEATDGLTLFRVTSCVDSVHKNQYTNDEFFTASQPGAVESFDGPRISAVARGQPGRVAHRHPARR